jgi:hypothetical protein
VNLPISLLAITSKHWYAYVSNPEYWVVQALLETRDFRIYIDKVHSRLVDLKKEKTLRVPRVKKNESERKKLTLASNALEVKLDGLFLKLKGEKEPVEDPIVDANAPIVTDGDLAPVGIGGEEVSAVIETKEAPVEIDERMTDRQADKERRASFNLLKDGLKEEIGGIQEKLKTIDEKVLELDEEAIVLQEEEDASVEENEKLFRQTVIQGKFILAYDR